MASNIKLIDCSNIKSLNYRNLDYKTKENARWENLVDIQLEAGDQMNIENAIINLKGASGDVVEITGENDINTKICDSKIGIKVIPYICDNGSNTVALPCCGCVTNNTYPCFIPIEGDVIPQFPQLSFQSQYDEDTNQGTGAYNNLYQYWSFISCPTTVANDNRTMEHYNFNEPTCNEWHFNFSYRSTFDNLDSITNNQWQSPLKSNLKTYYTEKAHIGNFEYSSGLKYTIIQSNYQGPFRADFSGNYRSNEDDFYPDYMEIKLDLGGAQYQAPSTICNMINDQLNDTDIYGSTETQKTVGKFLDVGKLPSITGTLLKDRFVNGMNSFDDDGKRVDYKKLWGNFAVRNLNEWTQVHYLMRLELANNNHFNLQDDTPYTTYYASYMIPTGTMTCNDGDQPGIDVGFYPRTSVRMTNSAYPVSGKYTDWIVNGTGNETNMGKYYYSTIPQYWLVCTNVKYNEANIKRFAKAFRANEIYDGKYSSGNDQDNDINNWRNHMDLGSSQQGANTRGWEDSEEYFCMSQGAVDLGVADWNSDLRTGYAFSKPCQPWGDYVPNIDNAYSTNRSDLPDIGTTSWYHYETTLGDIKQEIGGFGNTIATKVNYFKDNKNHDCTPAVYSRYQSNWRNLYKTDNFTDGHSTTSNQAEGFGQYNNLADSVIADNDDSLSKQYNVGVYPINMDFNSNHGEQDDLVCCFLLYRDSATWNESSNSWDISNDYALPCMHQGQFLVSASFLDHPAVWLVSGQRWDDENDLLKSNVNPGYQNAESGINRTENINTIKIGCQNPTFSFDNNLAKCAFSNLHNVKKLGLNDMPKTNDGDDNEKYDFDIANMGNEVIKINNTNIKYSLVWSMYETMTNVNEVDTPININGDFKESKSWGLIHSTGGIYLDSFYGEGINDNYSTTNKMTLLTADNWDNCLLNKLGFLYSDLIVKHGNPTNVYDSSKRHVDNPVLYPYLLKPLTTNPVIDIAQAGTLGVSDYTAGLSANQQTIGDAKYGALPLYNGSIGSLQQINLDGGTSESLFASNLPQKLESPYYIVYSDIASSYYVQNNNELSVVGVIVKNYISGDYIYSFETPPFNILYSRKITSINIEIRDNSGRVVPLDKNNSIIFKLVKNTLNTIVDKGTPLEIKENNSK